MHKIKNVDNNITAVSIVLGTQVSKIDYVWSFIVYLFIVND